MGSSIPDPAAPDLAAAFSKPADADPNLVPDALVRRAVLQLRSFGTFNQGQVRHFLPCWHHFRELNADQMLAIVATFPPGEDQAPRHWVDPGSGPGYEAPAGGGE